MFRGETRTSVSDFKVCGNCETQLAILADTSFFTPMLVEESQGVTVWERLLIEGEASNMEIGDASYSERPDE